jgi:hypothetical protein
VAGFGEINGLREKLKIEDRKLEISNYKKGQFGPGGAKYE